MVYVQIELIYTRFHVNNDSSFNIKQLFIGIHKNNKYYQNNSLTLYQIDELEDSLCLFT